MRLERTHSKSGGTSAFTLIEVCIAMTILGLTIASSIVALRIGFGMMESARDNTLASQILQSEVENLRLKNWQKLKELQDGPFQMEETFQETAAGRFSCQQVVDEPKSGLLRVRLQVTWDASLGPTRTLQYVTYFSQEGLNDYYYRVLPQ